MVTSIFLVLADRPEEKGQIRRHGREWANDTVDLRGRLRPDAGERERVTERWVAAKAT